MITRFTFFYTIAIFLALITAACGAPTAAVPTNAPTHAAPTPTTDPVVYYRNRASTLISVWQVSMHDAAQVVQRQSASLPAQLRETTAEMQQARENIAGLEVPTSMAEPHKALLTILESCENSVNDYADAVEKFDQPRQTLATNGLKRCADALTKVRAVYPN